MNTPKKDKNLPIKKRNGTSGAVPKPIAIEFNNVYNIDFRTAQLNLEENYFIVSDPPYNQNYHYSSYSDNVQSDEYLQLLQEAFGERRSVIIHYPEPTINLLPAVTFTICTESVSWVYNSNTAKQSRLISWWNCKPDFKRVGQAYKNPNDKRIKERMADGKEARLYDWWDVPQVKNVSKLKTGNPHPCPIPEELARRIILTTTNVGDIV